MDLQQEYYTRNGITAPVIRYMDRNYLIVHNKHHKANGYPRLMVIQMTWTNKPETHPGTFKFSQMVPLHDSAGSNPSYLKSIWEKKLEWDEWENFLLTWADTNKQGFVPCDEDSELAAWEMFFYSHDTWLAQNLPAHIQDQILTILDPETDAQVRKKVGAEIETYIKNKSRNVAQALHNFKCYSDGRLYATWLANLLK